MSGSRREKISCHESAVKVVNDRLRIIGERSTGMSRKPNIAEYHEPAGGWGAALAAGAALWEQGVLLKSGVALLFMNKPGGFKCPSCAWPDPPPHSDPLVFCENGAKALAWESTKKRATPELFSRYSVTELARQSDYWLEQQGRITHPMTYDPVSDHYVPVQWPEAFEVIAKELRALPHPNEAEFYTSGRSSNEAAFLYQLFAENLARTTFLTVPTSAMSQPVKVFRPPSVLAKEPASLRILTMPMPFSLSARTPERIALG